MASNIGKGFLMECCDDYRVPLLDGCVDVTPRRTGVNKPKSAPHLRFEQIFGFETKVQGSKRSFAKRSPRMSRGNREALRNKKSQIVSQGREEGAERSIKKGQRGTSCMYHINGTCRQPSRQSDCGKLMDGLWQKCVSERHGAETERFVEGCQSNRMKENDEATSMLHYHSQRQKRTIRSFKNKTSYA